MAEDVTLYFAPFNGSNAVGLQIEESVDGVGSWVPLADTSEIGVYPNWISSFTVVATSIDFWFRLRWELTGGAFTEWSDPVLGSALPFHWTVPDLYRLVTHHNVKNWSNIQLQVLIDRAYYTIQDVCGPYDESLPGFADVAQLVIHSVMDQMLPALTSSGVGFGSGMESETIGSYSYRRRMEGLTAAIAAAFTVPFDLVSIICPFGSGDSGLVTVETTHVFSQTDYHLAGTDQREKVFTTEDRHKLAYDVSPYPWWPRWFG